MEKYDSVGLLRCFMAIIYDSLLLFSALLLAAALAYLVTNGQTAYPIANGQISLVFRIYLLMVVFFYFAWPWLHGGQTLGMKAWRIQLQSIDNKPLSWQQVTRRFLVAIVSWLGLGMGFFWAIIDKQKRTWHDLGSGTRLVYLRKT